MSTKVVEIERKPHEWQPSPYGHGELACKWCFATNREIAVIGDLNYCPERTKKDRGTSP
jgi:hypothetical protein